MRKTNKQSKITENPNGEEKTSTSKLNNIINVVLGGVIVAVVTGVFSLVDSNMNLDKIMNATRTAESMKTTEEAIVQKAETFPTATLRRTYTVTSTLSQGAISPPTPTVSFTPNSSITPTSDEFAYEEFSGVKFNLLFFLPGTNPYLYSQDKSDNEIFTDSNRISLPKGNTFSFGVENDLDDETLFLNNRIPIRVIEYSNLDEAIDVAQMPQGGGGQFNAYVVDIPPSSNKIVWAELSKSDQANKEIPFYYLEPHKIEAFDVMFNFSYPGKYVFVPGIAVIKDNKNYIAWMDEPLIAIVPKIANLWEMDYSKEDLLFIFSGRCTLLPLADGYKFKDFYKCEAP